jgi:TolB-like protein/Tfp pilus assembly protein PilF
VDLKRRKVYRVAAAYGAVAFVLGQTAAFVFPALHLPDRSLTVLVVLLILGFPLALVLSWAFDLTPEGLRRTPPRALVSPSDDGAASVAVLPFVPMGSEDGDEAFCDGLTEEILNGLAGVDGLRVVSRTSSFAFKGRDRDIREIARSLDADAVLEGSVRRGGGGVRVTAQLIRGSDGFHLFSETYDRPLDDPVAVQEELSRAVTHALRRTLVEPADGLGPAGDTEVADEVERGRELLARRTPDAIEEARELFRGAVERAPDLAPAHAGLAEALALLADMGTVSPSKAFPAALAAARRAVELDEGLARAHAVLGFTRVLAWDWKGVERHFRRALELDPESVPARRWHSLYLSAMGRLPEAIREAEEVLRLEPGSAGAHVGLSALHYCARQPARALECCDRALELEPGALFPRVLAGMVHGDRGDHARAKAELKEAMARDGTEDPLLAAALARVHAAAGDEPGARALLSRLAAPARGGRGSGFLLAAVHGALGRGDEAFKALEEAVSSRDGWLLALKVHPWMDELRSDGRFAEVLRSVGLADGSPGEGDSG